MTKYKGEYIESDRFYIVMVWLFYLLWIIFAVMGGYESEDVESIRN